MLYVVPINRKSKLQNVIPYCIESVDGQGDVQYVCRFLVFQDFYANRKTASVVFHLSSPNVGHTSTIEVIIDVTLEGFLKGWPVGLI